MNHFKTERRAIYDTARFFNECGWIFREQTVVDLGVDALVETPIDENGNVKIFGIQIKGGGSNFSKTKNSLAFYFSERHYYYWNAISKIYPLFIILQDNKGKIYWQEYNQNFISKTSKYWKLNIPFQNVFNEKTKEKILDILFEKKINKKVIETNYSFPIQKKEQLIISYSKTKSSIFIHVTYKNKTVVIDLFYQSKPKEWDCKTSFLNWESQYYYSLLDFEEYIRYLFNKNNNSYLFFEKITTEIELIINGNFENVQEFIFDYQNKEKGIPQYSDFLKAFEQYKQLSRNQYEAQALGSIIHFKTKEEQFEISCYESLTDHLKSYIKNYSYDEIYTQTDQNIWSEIYIDAGIEKAIFIPVMQNELERYWQTLYKKIKKQIGKTKHLDDKKKQSWRMFKAFIDLYDNAGCIIELAYRFDEMVLYPIAVISMMKIFDENVCYSEYCELEFNQNWEDICLKEEDYNTPYFYIKPIYY
ncbi:DUF4365 domain-containing protein [Capnocytophaga canimorsus]|uniref:DUF4365 domain-containing protein n=1 Tax=Capnocytophaga canimorsus TaxID=28188 RepID=UPI0037D3B4BF